MAKGRGIPTGWTVAMVNAHEARVAAGAGRRVVQNDIQTVGKPAVVLHSAIQPSVLAARFEGIWEVLANTPPYVKELEGIDGRRFRFDYAFIHPVTGKPILAVELEGTTHQGGRHQRKDGFESDAEKYFLAALVHGWIIVRLTKRLITPERLVLIRDRINELRQ